MSGVQSPWPCDDEESSCEQEKKTQYNFHIDWMDAVILSNGAMNAYGHLMGIDFVICDC